MKAAVSIGGLTRLTEWLTGLAPSPTRPNEADITISTGAYLVDLFVRVSAALESDLPHVSGGVSGLLGS